MIIHPEHLTREKYNTIKMIMQNREYQSNNVFFGGSLALYLNGLIDRRIGDIDLCTWHKSTRLELINQYGIHNGKSQNSNIDGIRHFGLYINNQNVCLFERSVNDFKYTVERLEYEGESFVVKCQAVDQIIFAKNKYKEIGVKKHISDDQRFALSSI